MENKKKSIEIYARGLPDNKGDEDRIYVFDIVPLYTNLEMFTGYYRITIPAIAINKEQEYAEFKEQEEFIYGLSIPHIDGWCCSIDLLEENLDEFLSLLKPLDYTPNCLK